MFEKQRWKWKLRCMSEADYELDMTFTVEDSLFMTIYKEGILSFARKHGKTIKGNPENVEEFEMDERYLSKMNQFITKPFDITRQSVLNDTKRWLMTKNVIKAVYRRVGKEWNIIITVGGVYTLK